LSQYPNLRHPEAVLSTCHRINLPVKIKLSLLITNTNQLNAVAIYINISADGTKIKASGCSLGKVLARVR
ncbi:hypothetical protein, partial [Escherichia coli]|uniref:hypothetical protein n=1 Tax=Escherichia coli TaxID=562 RepID=UPI001BC8BDC4